MSENKTNYSNLGRKKEGRSSAILPSKETYLGKRKKQAFDTPIGTIKDSGVRAALSQIDRENHTHVLGSTGMGKSKFLELLIREDLKNPNVGMCLLDPHGSLFEEVKLYAAHKHSRLADRFVFFDPSSDLEHIVGFNPIANGSQKMDTLLDVLISAVLKPWGQDNPDNSPRISTWLENIFYPLIVNNLTLVESPPLLSAEKVNPLKDRLLQNVNSHTILSDWISFDHSNETMRKQMIEGASNRIRKFLRNEAVRNILGQQEHILNFQEIMDEKKILLINLKHTDRLTKPNTRLLGTMIVNEMFRTAMLRDPLDKSLPPFNFYIDEFANFITRDVADSLEQLRKFNVRMILSHQHLAQLKEEDEYLYASVMTCCKNKVVFGGLAPEDAELMTKSIATGHLDLKSVKHEQYKVRERHFEETREVHTKNWSDSNSTGQSRGTSSTNSTSQTGTKGQSSTDTSSQTDTRSHSQSNNQSRGKTSTESQGVSDSRGISEGRSDSTMSTSSQTLSHGKSTSTGGSNTISSQQARTQGISESDTHGTSQGRSDSRGGNKTDTRSHSSMQGNSQGRTSTQGQQQTHGSSTSDSGGSGYGSSSGTNQNSSSSNNQHYDSAGFRESGYSANRGEGSGSNQSQSENSFYSQSQGSNESWGTNQSNSQSQTQNKSNTDTHGRSSGENWSHSDNHGENQSRTSGHSSSESQSNGKSQADTFNNSQSQSEANSRGLSEGSSTSHAQNSSHTTNRGQSQGQSQTIGSSNTQGGSHAQGRSHADSRSSSQSHSSGVSEGANESRSTSQSRSDGGSSSTVPFVRSEEITELASTTFWSKDEMMYMTQGDIMNQDVAQAFIKIGNNPPIRCEIDEVKGIYYSQKQCVFNRLTRCNRVE